MMRASSLLRRRSPFLLLAAALIALLAVPAVHDAPTASASHEHEVWSATLTLTDTSAAPTLNFGCDNAQDSGGTLGAHSCARETRLTDDEFTFLGRDYAILKIAYASTGTGIGFDSNALDDVKLLTLHVGSKQFPLADFTPDASVTPGGTFLGLAATLPRQSEGGTLDLKLTFTEQHAGDLDPTFGYGGKLTTAFNAQASQINAMAVQSDGKVVAAGYTTGADKDFALARYNTDGSLDTTFGTGGFVVTDFGTSDDEARGVAIQSNGRIVAAGNSGENVVLARYTSAGVLDTTFSTDGKVTTPKAGSLNAVAVQSNGKIVVAGVADSMFVLKRYKTNGSLDTTFGDTGAVKTDIGTGSDEVNALAIQSDDKIVAAGYATWADKNFAVARYNADGTLDNTFTSDGWESLDVGQAEGTSSDEVNAVAIQSDGKIVLAGVANNKFALVRYRSDGVLDTGFGTGGRVTTNISAGDNDNADVAQAVHVQSDGKIVAAGYATWADKNFAVARYTAAGALDTTFSTDGWEAPDLSAGVSNANDAANAAAIQSDGKILLAGYAYNGSVNEFALARLTAGGSLDSDYGIDGKVTTSFGGNADEAKAVAVQSSGRIVVAGYANNGSVDQMALSNYGSDGSLESAFGTGGRVVNPGSPSDASRFNAVAVQSDDQIIAAGRIGSGASSDFVVGRFLTNGLLDGSFGVSGLRDTDFASGEDQAHALAIQSDGKIVVAGYANNGTDDDFALVRLTSAGALDTSFSSDGKLTTHFGSGDDRAYAVAVQSDSKIIVAGFATLSVAGFATLSTNPTGFALVRYNADGTLDTTFGNGGKSLTRFGFDGDRAYAMALQPDGKILLVGYAHDGADNDFALARYNANGTLDTTFGTRGKVTTDTGSGDSEVRAMALQSDGKIVVAGQSIDSSFNYNFALARYRADGSLDTGFGNGGKVTTDFAGYADEANALAIDSDQNIVLGGFAQTGEGFASQEFGLARYLGEGTFSADATLSALAVSASTDGSAFNDVTLTPAFHRHTAAYAATLAAGVTHVKITPTAGDAGATVRVTPPSGSAQTVASASASAAVAVNPGSNVFSVRVAAEDGRATRTYTVTLESTDRVRLYVSPARVAEGSSATIRVTLTSAQAGDVSIPLTYGNDTSETGDYQAPASITVSAGSLQGSGVITTAHDTDADDETFTVSLAANLPGGLGAGVPSSVTVTIVDDEVAPRVWFKRVYNAQEGETAYVTVGISPALPAAVTIPVTITHLTSEAGDFQSLSSITIEANQPEAAAAIRTNQDADTDDETFRVALGGNLPGLILAGTPSQITVEIEDDDFESTVWIKRAYNAQEGETAYVTVGISPARPEAVTIPVTLTHVTSEAGDFQTLSSITIEANQPEAAAAIRTNQDADKDDETFTVALGSNLPPLVTLGLPDLITVKIEDDDFASRVWFKRAYNAREGETAYVTVGISPAQPAAVTVPVTTTHVTSEAGDFQTLSSITIEANQPEAAGAIRTNQDADTDDETFRVALGGNLPGLILAGTPSQITVEIEDDDGDDDFESSVWFKRVYPDPVREGETAYVTVGISPARPAAVTIPVTLTHVTSEAGDFQTLSSITIEANQPEAAGAIRTNQDTDTDDETFTVNIGSNLPPLLTAGSPSQITVTIDDDDSPTAPRERPFPLPIMRGDGALTLTWHMRPDQWPYTGYDVEYKVKGTGTPTTGWSDAGHTGTERRHVITGLTNGTTYETRIRARTDGGAGPWSRTVAQGQSADTVEGTPVAPPAAPTGLSVSPGRGYLAASWTAPSGEVTAYHLRFRETGSSTWWKWRSSRNDAWVSIYKTSATILSSKLTKGVAHDVQVRAFIEDSVGPWSATAQGTPE